MPVGMPFFSMVAMSASMTEPRLHSSTKAASFALSRAALDSLSGAQRAQLESKIDTLVTATIPTIERLGGGSVRCMLAEIFLPRGAK